jgi:hypothetical protein
MKALIVYDDATCAATTNAILHQAADRADISVKWDIRPWRLNMLRFPPTAEEAMSDAADAHLIVFAIRNTQSFPTWLMKWLERWAVLRQSPGAALAIIGCGTAEASVAMRQFARRFGLSFIWEGQEPQLGVGFLIEAASTEYKLPCFQPHLILEIGRTTGPSLLRNQRVMHIVMDNQNHCVKASVTRDFHRTNKNNNLKGNKTV